MLKGITGDSIKISRRQGFGNGGKGKIDGIHVRFRGVKQFCDTAMAEYMTLWFFKTHKTVNIKCEFYVSIKVLT